jgi:hypothetical protein
MNIQGGGISFEISGTNDKLLRILKQSKSSMQNFSGEVKKGGKDIDSAFNAITSSISKARADLDKTDVAWTKTYENMTAKLQELKTARDTAYASGNDKEYSQLNEQVKALERQVTQWEAIGAKIREAYNELDQEDAAIRRQYDDATKAAQAHGSIRSQLRECREQLALMEADGKRGTEEYKRMQQEAGRLTDAFGDAAAQARILAHDNGKLQGVISGISGITGAVTAAQGAMSLFIGENENLQKAMLKVQSLMSITMGLQQVYNTINKDSAFMLVIVAKAKDALTAANARLAAALGISTAAAQALMATLTLGLSAAITAIIVLISKFSSESAKAKKVQEEFNKKVAEASGEPLAAYMALQAEWLSLTGSMKEREKWVQDNADKFSDLGWQVRNAKEAEDLLVRNTAKVIEAFMLRAKANAAMATASEKYKEIVEEQLKLDGIQQYEYSTGLFKNEKTGKVEYGVHKEVTQEWLKQNAVVTKLQAGVQKYVDMVVELNAQEKAILAQIGQQTNKAVEGSVRAAERELQRLTDLYNTAANDKERAKFAKQIEAQQKIVDRLSLNQRGGKGGSGSGSGAGKTEDPFKKMLDERKALYAKYSKWAQSEDETVRAAADKEFAALLKQGTSYLDFLQKQRDEISNKAKKTAEDLRKLQLINNEIAETTKQTVLSDFDKQLQADLEACKTIGEMLNVIQKQRDELSNDNSEIDTGKKDILNKAEESTTEQAKKETAELLNEYASYLNEKLVFEESYARKRELLTKQLAAATTDKERAVAEAALAGLERKRKEYEQRSASERYDELKQQYQTYQQQLTEIQKKYQEEREEAERNGNLAMITQINAKEQAELSKLAAEKLRQSESWNQLFSDLSMLSSKTIDRLMADINAQKVTLSAQLDPADLKALNDQLQKAKDELHKRNPFLALRDSLKELRAAMNADKLLDSNDPFIKSLEDKKAQYKQYSEAVQSDDETLANAAKHAYADLLKEGSSYIDYLRRKIAELNGKKIKLGVDFDGDAELAKLEAALNKETGATKTFKEGLKDTFASVSSTIDFVSGTFDSVVGGMKKMGVTMDEETEHVLGDISQMMDGASQVAQGIATGNPLSIIQGSVGFLSSAFDLFNSRDRKAEKSIKQHEKAVTRLGRSYTQLQHQVNKALGETVYQNQSAMIRNLRQQQVEMRGMIEDEKSKKKTDWDRIEEWEEKIAANSREIEDIIADITKSITQTDAKSAADELGEALINAFEGGTSAAKAFDKVSGDILRNAVINALKLQFLEQPLQNAIKRLQRDMGFDEEGNGSFDGLTEAEQKRFRDSVAKAGANFAEAFKVYEDLFNELNEKDPSTLSGAIKGASQESIDLLAGQANAVRMNQVTSLDLLRQQLTRLSNIDANVGVIASRLLAILNRLTAPADDGLRGQGITD